MIKSLLIWFVSVISLVPWWLMVFHACVKNGYKALSYFIYVSIVPLAVGVAYYLFHHSYILFSYQFSENFFFKCLGVMFFMVVMVMDFQVMKMLGLKRLAMLPEFTREQGPKTFVAQGVYKYCRHPRYVEYMLVSLSVGLFFGYAFFIYFFVYLIFSFWLATELEEAELVDHFGESYRDYQKQVRRFFII